LRKPFGLGMCHNVDLFLEITISGPQTFWGGPELGCNGTVSACHRVSFWRDVVS